MRASARVGKERPGPGHGHVDGSVTDDCVTRAGAGSASGHALRDDPAPVTLRVTIPPRAHSALVCPMAAPGWTHAVQAEPAGDSGVREPSHRWSARRRQERCLKMHLPAAQVGALARVDVARAAGFRCPPVAASPTVASPAARTSLTLSRLASFDTLAMARRAVEVAVDRHGRTEQPVGAFRDGWHPRRRRRPGGATLRAEAARRPGRWRQAVSRPGPSRRRPPPW